MNTIEIYADTRGVSKCTGPNCGRRILWAVIVETGRKMCFDDLDLPALRTRHDKDRRLIEEVDRDTNHWATCPDSKSFKRTHPKKEPKEDLRGTNRPLHQCYVSYCDKRIPVTYLMCPAHWSKVSPGTMKDVWKWYRAKTANAFDETATANHWEAIEKARKEVETKERGWFA